MSEKNKSHVVMLEQNKTHLQRCQKSDQTNFSTPLQFISRRFPINALPCQSVSQSVTPLFETEACGDVEFTQPLPANVELDCWI